MLYINSFIFLLTISISTLVVPSIVPKISLLTSILLLGAILLNSMFSNSFSLSKSSNSRSLNKPIGFENINIPYLAIFLLFLWKLVRYFYVESNIYSDLNLIVMHVLFLFFIVMTSKSISSYIKTYVYFVFIMAFLGLVANTLFIFDFINPDNHGANISIMTNGAFTRDADFLESYVFPYYLGFILTGDGQLNLLGFEFYRISGWAHEPTSATLFIAPAILILLHGDIINNKLLRTVMLFTIGLFWFFVMSVGSMLAFMTLYSLIALFYFYQHFFHKSRIMAAIFMVFIISIPFLFIYVEPILQSTIFTSKFNLEAHTLSTAYNKITWFIPDINKSTIFYFSHLALWAIILTFLLSSILILISNTPNKVYSLILLYIVIHSMKGSQETVFYLTFTFFWLYIAYFSWHKSV